MGLRLERISRESSSICEMEWIHNMISISLGERQTICMMSSSFLETTTVPVSDQHTIIHLEDFIIGENLREPKPINHDGAKPVRDYSNVTQTLCARIPLLMHAMVPN